MKFGKLLRENKVKGWEKYYVEYKALKKLIKVCDLYPTKEDIGYFQQRIAQDIQKITTFYTGQVRLYRAQFNHLKKIAERQNISSRQASETEWVDFQTTSRRLIDNIRALKDYGLINSEGLRKIVKKYDKRCSGEGEKMTEAFVLELNQQSFHRQEGLQVLAKEVTLFILRLPVKGDPIRLSAKSSQALDKLRIVRDLLDEATTAGKQMVIPIAVEPRTYMANERTFLKWLRVAVTAVTAGVSLIAFMGHNMEFIIPGIIILVVGFLLMIRSWFIYKRRLSAMTKRIEIDWSDSMGSIIITLSLLVPIVFYVIFVGQYGILSSYFAHPPLIGNFQRGTLF